MSKEYNPDDYKDSVELEKDKEPKRLDDLYEGSSFLSLGSLSGIIMVLVVIGIVMVVGLRIANDLGTSMDTATYNATEQTMQSLMGVMPNGGLLGTIIIFGVIISVIMIAFVGLGRSSY